MTICSERRVVGNREKAKQSRTIYVDGQITIRDLTKMTQNGVFYI